MAPLPITLITGFLGSGKTTLLLSLVPQLKAANPAYKLALLKNEFGDVAVDSQLAAGGDGPSALSGVRELLNGCICCNLVGQLGPALAELRAATPGLDRVVVETSGSAFPATLAMEVNRLARETAGAGGDGRPGYVLDGVVTVVDVENWTGYEDTSYTARAQAKYTDLVVFNKWEACDERRFDECLDRLGDLELEVPLAWVKSDKGRVPAELVFGIDGGLARTLGEGGSDGDHGGESGHAHAHIHDHAHQSEVEVLSITLRAEEKGGGAGEGTVDPEKLLKLLQAAPKDEVYRIKAIVASSLPLPDSNTMGVSQAPDGSEATRYIVNWAFGRWTSTPMQGIEHSSTSGEILCMTMIFARDESNKWKRRLESGGYLELKGGGGILSVKKIT